MPRTSTALEPHVLAAIQPGDGRHGQGNHSAPAWRPSSRRCKTRYPPRGTGDDARPAFDHERLTMLYLLSAFSDTIGPLNVLRYITFRTGGAMITALVFVFLFGAAIIDQLRLRQGKGQPIRSDGPQSHPGHQEGHADHGRG